MRIVSYNCWGAGLNVLRFKALAHAIVNESPDIICLQEVVFNWQVEILTTQFRQRYEIFHTPSRFGYMNQGGLYTAVLKDFPVSDCLFTAFVEQGSLFHPLAYSDRLLQKGWSKLMLRIASKQVYIINTHLIGSYGLLLHAERATVHQQRTQLEQAVAPILGAMIVCGDFNLQPALFSSDSYFRRLDEVFALSEEEITVDNGSNPLRQGKIARLCGRGNTKPNKRSDYMFFRQMHLLHAEVVFHRQYVHAGYEGFLSEHYGIMATLEINP